VAVVALGTVALAEVGRRRAGGRSVFGPTAPLWALPWLAERSVCSWLAVARRLGGGVPYAGGRLRTAAHTTRQLRRTVPARPPLPPLPLADRAERLAG
jgi:hypothetical protein